jgi:hypothetical protein
MRPSRKQSRNPFCPPAARVFVKPDIHRHAADAALKMRLAFRRGQVAFCDSAAQAVFSRDDLQRHIIIPPR